MAKEVERVRAGGVQPYDPGHSDPAAFVPYTSGSQIGTPDFTEIRPPENGRKMQDAWAKNPIVLGLRAKWRAQLWLTEYWWRSAILLAVVAAIVIVFIVG